MASVRVIVGIALAARVASAQPASPACVSHQAGCDWRASMSPLEIASLGRALTARGLELDPAPWGKVIDTIHVYNEDVFAEDNWLQFFNHFHFTTREHAIREELTIHEGEVWNDDLVAESARILHDPLYSSVIVFVPVVSKAAGKVDMLVVTRDVFSIRLNTQFRFQEGSLTNLSISLSENNFLGQRDLFSAAVLMDQGAIAVGPLFVDKNLLGKHIYLSARVDEVLTRRSLDVIVPSATPGVPAMHMPTGDPKGIQDGGGLSEEGRDATITLSRPLWSLASEWGGGTSFGYSNGTARSFYTTGLYAYQDPNTGVYLPWEYRQKSWSLDTNGVRQWGTVLKHQLSLGYRVTSTSPSLVGNFPNDPQLQADFTRDVLPRTEQLSGPYAEYSFFQPRYAVVRNIGTYELPEDLRIGPDLDLSIWQGLHALRSDAHFTRPSLTLGWTFPWCRDGFIRPSAGGSLRLQSYDYADGRHEQTIDNTAVVQVRAATPTLSWFRVIAQSYLDTRWHDTQNVYYYLGGDPGLRGYDINVLRGQRMFLTQIEMRTVPFSWWVLRLGGVAFYDFGGTANSLPHMGLYHDVGIGVRTLVPQTSRELLRIDLAFPLQVGPDGAARFRPHPLLSYQSAF